GSLRYGRTLRGLRPCGLERLLQHIYPRYLDARIRRIATKYKLSDKKAKDTIIKTDKSRSSYYNYYTNKKWGDAQSYNLCIDSSKLGIDSTAQVIIQAVQIFDASKK